MYSHARTLIKWVAWIGAAMIIIVVFHIGGSIAHVIGQFSPLTGALIGGALVLSSVLIPMRRRENVERWIGNEQLSWTLIGLGVVMWALGEMCWRYFVAVGQAPFPSIADIGYSSFPLLIFTGLLLQPPSEAGSRRLILLLDSLISMGSVLAIAWYLLLGSLAQATGEANLAKFLGLYYPVSDTALLSCVIFLLLRGQGRAYQANARRIGLLVVGLGLCFFVSSDFLFNIQQNAGTYVEATWVDMGWPLGMMTIGIAALLRRFSPATAPEVIEGRLTLYAKQDTFGPTRFIPYILVGLLFLVLSLDVMSSDSGSLAIRPVLLFATMGVVALVVVRQIYTLWENVNLARKQAEALDDLATANQRIEEQSHLIVLHNAELESGIAHLTRVQAQIANGNLQARATLSSGALLPLAGSLNIMAERLMRLGQMNAYGQRLSRALGDLYLALERKMGGAPLVIPASCKDFPEIDRLLFSLRLKGNAVTTDPLPPRASGPFATTGSLPPRGPNTPLPTARPEQPQLVPAPGARRSFPRLATGSRQPPAPAPARQDR